MLPSLPVGRQRCQVSFVDTDGLRHTAEVEANSLFEAAVMALKVFKNAPMTEVPKLATRLSVEIMSPVVRHEVSVRQVHAWLEAGGVNPHEQARKRDLRALLET